ncbi:unnamed protein product [Sphagnum troendelagicum]
MGDQSGGGVMPLLCNGTTSPMDNTTLPPIKAVPGIIPPSNSSAASSSSSPAGKLSVRRERKPVSPRTPSDMIGAQEERDTGLLNPYNLWGPVSKYGYLETVPLHPTQKQHFGGKLDAGMKQRLGTRKFGHIRHPSYNSLIEPSDSKSPAWMDPKRQEFWRTDVEAVLHRDADKQKAREKELLGVWANQEAGRRERAKKVRDIKYQAFVDMTNNMRKGPGNRNNQSSAPHINIITREPIISKETTAMSSYKKDLAQYNAASRALFLQSKRSGTRMYNVITWLKCPPCRDLPPKPIRPPTPPYLPPMESTRKPLNCSKGALSYGHLFGPFGTIMD